jgi:hypothetical protein
MSGSQSIAIVVSLAVLAAVVTVISGAAFYYNRYHRSQAPADIERTLTGNYHPEYTVAKM